MIPDLPKTMNYFLGKGWRHRDNHRKNWHGLVAVHLNLNDTNKKKFKTATLILERHSSKEPDPDGLVGSFKHVIDGLVACGKLEDDKYSNIGMPEFYWHKAPPKKGFIFVTIIGKELSNENK